MLIVVYFILRLILPLPFALLHKWWTDFIVKLYLQAHRDCIDYSVFVINLHPCCFWIILLLYIISYDMSYYKILQSLNTLRPRQNGCKFTEDTFKRIYLNEDVRIFIKIPLKFVPKGPINNIPALVQIMAWHRPGDKPLSEPMLDSPMLDSLLTYICVTRPQWSKLVGVGIRMLTSRRN